MDQQQKVEQQVVLSATCEKLDLRDEEEQEYLDLEAGHHC
jgi:hypothetical protein